MSVKRTIYIGLLVISILPIILTSGLQIATINFWSDSLISKNLVNSANSFKAIIEDFFVQQNIDMSIVSHLPQIKEYLDDTSQFNQIEARNELRKKVSDKYYIDFYVLYNAEKKQLITTNPLLTKVYEDLPVELDGKIGNKVFFTDFMDHPLYDNQNGIILGVAPIVVRGETTGYLLAGYNNSYFSHIIENVSLENKVKVRLEDGFRNVVSTLGLFVLKTGQQNNFDEIVSTVDFEKNPTGTITYDNYRYEEIAYYTPIEGTSLRLFAAVNMNDYRYPSHTILTNMFIVFLVVTILVLLIMSKIAQTINTFMESTLDTMIRIKNGDYKARLSFTSKYEIQYIAETFNDLLNTIEHNNDELYQGSERYRIAVKTFSDVFFELNIIEDEIEFGETPWSMRHNLHHKQAYSKVFDWFYGSYVYEEDQDLFYESLEPASLLEHFQKMESGEISSIKLDFRWIHSSKSILWVSMTVVPMHDKNGVMSSMVGYVKNIHEQKIKEMKLIQQAQQDGLTKINNKMTTQRLIEEILSESDDSQQHALLIVDLDDFKQVNDTHGHLVGDEVLRIISELLQTKFRASDIVGRIGGDEFLIFMQNVDFDVVKKKANEIIMSLRDFAELPYDINVSCSIGIAMYPGEGMDFMELFEQADKALYVAKEAGKNQFNI